MARNKESYLRAQLLCSLPLALSLVYHTFKVSPLRYHLKGVALMACEF